MLLADAEVTVSAGAGPARKPIDIEALLKWAYCEELPKAVERQGGPLALAIGRGWAKVESYLQLLTVIDVNRYGVVPDVGQDGEPHPDAVEVYLAVCALEALDLDLPDAAEWQAYDDLGDLGPEGLASASKALASMVMIDADGRRRLKRTPRRLVEKHAILGGHPDWECEQPERRFVKERGKDKWFRTIMVDQADGTKREVEVEGYDQGRQRPFVDAYRKMELSPDPTEALVYRAEYEVWRAALDVLIEDLADVLTAHRLTPSVRTWRPWEAGERAREPRVLADLSTGLGASAKWALRKSVA